MVKNNNNNNTQLLRGRVFPYDSATTSLECTREFCSQNLPTLERKCKCQEQCRSHC